MVKKHYLYQRDLSESGVDVDDLREERVGSDAVDVEEDGRARPADVALDGGGRDLQVRVKAEL